MKYHQMINEADALFGYERFDEALEMYDATFEEFERSFVIDYLMAAQIATITNAHERTSFYLDKALKWGYPFECVESLDIFETFTKQDQWQRLKSRRLEYRRLYYTHTSFELNEEFSLRYREEQDTKSYFDDEGRDVYVGTVMSNYNRIKYFMDSVGFPSEFIIGLDDGRLAPNKQNTLSGLSFCQPGNNKVIVTLLHCDNPITDIGLEKFVTAIEAGLLHPRDFAYVFTFEKNYVSRLSESRHVNQPNLPAYHFNFPFGQNHEDLEKVNRDRATFGITSVEVDARVDIVQEKYRFNIIRTH